MKIRTILFAAATLAVTTQTATPSPAQASDGDTSEITTEEPSLWMKVLASIKKIADPTPPPPPPPAD